MYDAHIPVMDRPISASKHLFETEITNSYSVSAENILYQTEISQSYSLEAESLGYEDTLNLRNLFVITSQKDDVEDLGNPQIR